MELTTNSHARPVADLVRRLEVLLKDARRLKEEAQSETERCAHDGLCAGYESALCEIHGWAYRAGIATG